MLFAGGIFGMVQWAGAYAHTFAPGVVLAGMDVAGKDPAKVLWQLREKVDALENKGLTFHYREHTHTFDAVLVGANDRDFAYELFSYDADAAIARAFAYGHTGSRMRQWFELAWGKFLSHEVDVPVTVNTQELHNVLEDALGEYSKSPSPARLAISWRGAEPMVAVDPESAGSVFPYESVVAQVVGDLHKLKTPDVTLTTISLYPTLTASRVEPLVPQAEAMLKRPSVLLALGDKYIAIGSRQIAEWLRVEEIDGEVNLTLDEIAIRKLLMDVFGDAVYPAQDAKFEMNDQGRVVIFQESKQGKSLELTATTRDILAYLATGKTATSTPQGNPAIPVTPRTIEPKAVTADGNDLGIKEIIGIGRSNFAGSPPNRRHNIATGAAALNGLLVKPGEEFSLLAALGDVDGEHGYKEELVIKGNKTIPEFGGGLCQIGTTTFRATLTSGLPITQRRNHSYRVIYYEPAGTDATIYNPWPDYRFMNDTGSYILIRTAIEGDELIFTFWGTKDGRAASQTEPRVYNITAPPPTKYIETLDLAPGTKKCTESAHAGADAEFTYSVAYPDGTEKDTTFTSHYRPWQAVCLVGVEKLSEGDGTATSTETTFN
ncbi:MAG: hypothetical protein AUK21_00120 [Parcubacteria group bacterium CG2_30_48_51]|nr:MAG: hypothetical protein AUK21_00120 [Parcubacteria group bacterium CG2_30_48_51]